MPGEHEPVTPSSLPVGGGGFPGEGYRLHVADVVETYVRGRVRRGEIVALTARNHRVVLNQFAEVADCKVSKLQARHVKRWQERYEHLAQATNLLLGEQPETEPPDDREVILPVDGR